MKRGDKKVMVIQEKEYSLVYLGRNQLVTFWQNESPDCPEEELIMIGEHHGLDVWCIWYKYTDHTGGPVKNWGWRTPGRYHPDTKQVYSMPLYQDLSAKAKDEWWMYKRMKEEWQETVKREISKRGWGEFNHNKHGSEVCYAFARQIGQLFGDAWGETFYNLADAGRNWSEGMWFDFSKANFGLADDGRLIVKPTIVFEWAEVK